MHVGLPQWQSCPAKLTTLTQQGLPKAYLALSSEHDLYNRCVGPLVLIRRLSLAFAPVSVFSLWQHFF